MAGYMNRYQENKEQTQGVGWREGRRCVVCERKVVGVVTGGQGLILVSSVVGPGDPSLSLDHVRS